MSEQRGDQNGGSPIQVLLKVARTQKFYWFLGHVSELAFFVLNALISLYSRSVKYYRLALLAVIFTYGIVVKEIHFRRQGLAAIRKRDVRVGLIRDENVQYLLIAVVFYVTSPITGGVSGGLYPFSIYSIFHVLTYFQSTLLPSSPVSPHVRQQLDASITNFTTSFSQRALYIAANAEFFWLSSFVLFIPFALFYLLRSPLYTITNAFVFVSVIAFLKVRYETNQYFKVIVSLWDMRINQFLLSGKLPPLLNELYNIRIKGLIHKITDPIQLPALTSSKKTT